MSGWSNLRAQLRQVRKDVRYLRYLWQDIGDLWPSWRDDVARRASDGANSALQRSGGHLEV